MEQNAARRRSPKRFTWRPTMHHYLPPRWTRRTRLDDPGAGPSDHAAIIGTTRSEPRIGITARSVGHLNNDKRRTAYTRRTPNNASAEYCAGGKANPNGHKQKAQLWRRRWKTDRGGQVLQRRPAAWPERLSCSTETTAPAAATLPMIYRHKAGSASDGSSIRHPSERAWKMKISNNDHHVTFFKHRPPSCWPHEQQEAQPSHQQQTSHRIKHRNVCPFKVVQGHWFA